MWFTKGQFALCNELRIWGLSARFEPGDVVARGFADLGFEEFQVLPGPSLLSLTTGAVTKLPEDHRQHFFWIPSVDEGIELLESCGVVINSISRQDGREWSLVFQNGQGDPQGVAAGALHDVVLRALHVVFKDKH